MAIDPYQHIAKLYDSRRNEVFYSRVAKSLSADITLNAAKALKNLGAQKSPQALDLGCGTMIATSVFVKKFGSFEWHALDASADMLRQAKKKSVSGVTPILGRSEALPFKDASISLLTCNFAFHWFDRDAVSEMRRVMIPGGIIALSIPLLGGVAKKNPINLELAKSIAQKRQKSQSSMSFGIRKREISKLFTDFNLLSLRAQTIEEGFSHSNEAVFTLYSRGGVAAMGLKTIKLKQLTDLKLTWNIGYLVARV